MHQIQIPIKIRADTPMPEREWLDSLELEKPDQLQEKQQQKSSSRINRSRSISFGNYYGNCF